jgi:hypothetical protein
MTIQKIAELLQGEILVTTGQRVKFAFASDLMSDVLTQDEDDVVLLTGLVNLQAVRTAEMADIPIVVFVRGKNIDEAILATAVSGGIGVIKSPLSLFHAAGVLYAEGLKPVY